MTQARQKNYKSLYSRSPAARRTGQEFAGRPGVMICPACKAVYYKKSWHHNFEEINIKKEDVAVTFSLCPADQMIHNGQYEGRIIIKNVRGPFERKLEEVIRSSCARAERQDPMDRLIDLKKRPNSHGAIWTITLTENQMTNRLAKRLKKSFSSLKTKTTFAKDPSDVIEVSAEFSIS